MTKEANTPLEDSVRSAGDAWSRAVTEGGRFVQALAEANAQIATGALKTTSDMISKANEVVGDGQRESNLVREYSDVATQLAQIVTDSLHESSKHTQRGIDRFSEVFSPEDESGGGGRKTK